MDKEIPNPSDEQDPSWLVDEQAKLEQENWNNEDKLKGQEETNKLWQLKVLGWIIPAMMISFATIFLVALISWSLHYVLPECWQWLTDEQLSKIQSVIFSGALGAIVSSYAQKHILK